MGTGAAPSFDLVVATLGRSDELHRLLTSLEHQTHRALRVVLVDQNEDDRAASVARRHPTLDLLELQAAPGLSRARNAARPHLTADVVAFPDDDCVYPDDLLERVAATLAARPELDGVSGQSADPRGVPSGRWPRARCSITLDTVWNRANSHTIFLRRALLEQTGPFDESLGLGSGRPWHSGEEIDLLVRALQAGARLEYDPEVVVLHPARRLTPDGEREIAARDAASVGYILGRHRLPRRIVGRMLTRPVGGALVALARRNAAGARLQATILRGRVKGLRAGRRA